MDIKIIINQMIELFILMFLGYILAKIGFMNKEFNSKFTKITLNVSMPALMLSSVMKQTGERNMTDVLIVFGAGLAMYIIVPVISWLLVKLLRIKKEKQGLYIFMGTYGNVGFMGFPIISAIYGDKAIFYTAIINLVFNLSVFSVGLPIMNYNTDKKSEFNIKSLKSPGIISAIAAAVIYFINIPFPYVITDTVSTIGSLTTPSAMLLIGATLAGIDIKKVFNELKLYPYAFFHQILIPIATYFLLRNLISDELIIGVITILIAMPIANTAVLFATEYGHDEELAAKSIFITTLLSAVTIPLIAYICF